ncbi:Aspartate 1-decarboxylase precursor [Planctopirus ephydatiae]|uniref:Aspartate 1-decarboxylase n=2 Tax=Planctopirus ephydatiae TaxID=2528019 RepID=A0A518GJL3_9PLAN|nr:Aspartate 1-decarboxylase precursor [Planctopirus ephydatiae]
MLDERSRFEATRSDDSTFACLVPGEPLGLRLMQRTFLKSKIHRATITEALLHYEGSITVDRVLLELADILVHEQVHIYNITNGERFITYAIEGPPNSGVICVNGAGARLVQPGDLIIICSYVQMETAAGQELKPKVILVDRENRALPQTQD